MAVKPIPDGYHTLTPYVIFEETAKAIAFYKQAFGATEVMRLPGPNGSIGHAEIKFGDSHLMMADANPEWGARSLKTIGGSPVSLMLYVKDVDAVMKQAIDAGAKVLRPLTNQFYGDRNATIEDPFGHSWTVATHVEDVSPEEITKRMAAMGEKK